MKATLVLDTGLMFQVKVVVNHLLTITRRETGNQVDLVVHFEA